MAEKHDAKFPYPHSYGHGAWAIGHNLVVAIAPPFLDSIWRKCAKLAIPPVFMIEYHARGNGVCPGHDREGRQPHKPHHHFDRNINIKYTV